MTTTYPAYRITDAHSKSTIALVWWDGERLRSTDANMLKYLKRQYIGSLTYESGEAFFKQLPRLFSSYVYTRSTEVTKDGQEV